MFALQRRAITIALSLIRYRPAHATEVWNVVMQSRALALEEATARHRSASGAGGNPRVELRDAFAGARHRLASLVVRGPAGVPMAEYREALDRASRDKQETERALVAATVPRRDAEKRDVERLSEIRAALPPASAIVALVQYNHSEWSRDRTPRVRMIPAYLAFVQRSDTAKPVVVHLGTAASIDALVSRWQDQVAQPASVPSFGASRLLTRYRAVAGQLRQRIWDPLATHLRGVQRVFVVPDGTLHLVDFSALPVGRSEYLAERLPVIHYLSSERDLLARAPRATSQGILTVGAPAFDGARALAAASTQGTGMHPAKALRGRRAICTLFEGVEFEPLPGTAREATDIASLWKRARRVRSSSQSESRISLAQGGVTFLSDAAANEAQFKADAPGKQVLHLATHGFFLGGPCPAALDRPASPAAAVARVTVQNPLLLSGLVFAGANRRELIGPQEEDGILMAEEIAGLDLRGVEWAVLSGCDTGIGHIQAGEGVFGLRRAFQIAGVRSVIMSLWQVEDESARQWMLTLYQRRFVAGRTTADAVRDASLELLRRRRAANASTHPFYWAGFVATGDWQ
jgi:CHAT domain-containing protein